MQINKQGEKKLRVLVACEYSRAVSTAFAKLGHEAVSCDLLSAEGKDVHFENGGSAMHYTCDVKNIIKAGNEFDLMIAHPPCTHLAVSGARWFKDKQEEQKEALEFVQYLLNVDIPHIALENPVSIISSRIRKPDQIIQPWMFGHEATKTTCLWLKNLPMLQPTNIVDKGKRHVTKSGKSLPEWYNLPPSPDRWKIRSATFQGIADAMAEQYSRYITN